MPVTRDLNQMDYLALYAGGIDGGIILDGTTDLTGAEAHMIEVLVDDTEFTVLLAQTQADATVNMLTVNNYSGKTWKAGKLLFPPFGGHITALTADQDVRYFKFPTSYRKRNE